MRINSVDRKGQGERVGPGVEQGPLAWGALWEGSRRAGRQRKEVPTEHSTFIYWALLGCGARVV